MRVDLRRRLGNVRLLDMEIGDAHFIPAVQMHILPDTFGNDTRAPVPAVLVVGLAYIIGRLFALGLVAKRRIELARQRVRLFEQPRLQPLDR